MVCSCWRCRIFAAIDVLITPPCSWLVLGLDPENAREDSCRSRTATAIAKEGKDGRADQRESRRLRDRGGDADDLFRAQKWDTGVKSGIDRVEESIRDQTLSDGPRVEPVGKEQVPWVVTRVDAVDFEAADDIGPGSCDFDEKLVDIDNDDPAAVFRDEVMESVVESRDRVSIGAGEGSMRSGPRRGPREGAACTEDQPRYRPRS